MLALHPPWKAAVISPYGGICASRHRISAVQYCELLNCLPSLSFQVAIIAGNFELAEIIKTHKESDVGEFDLFSLPLFSLFNLTVESRTILEWIC